MVDDIIVERYGTPRVAIVGYQPYPRLVEAEQELLRMQLRHASRAVSARAAHLSDDEINVLIEQARAEVYQAISLSSVVQGSSAMIVLNFSHPLIPARRAQIDTLASQSVTRVVDLPTQCDVMQSFSTQTVALADAMGLSPIQWQTLAILVNLPALNTIASLLLVEMHDRMGHFPAILRLRPVAGMAAIRYETARIINLQTARDQARARR